MNISTTVSHKGNLTTGFVPNFGYTSLDIGLYYGT